MPTTKTTKTTTTSTIKTSTTTIKSTTKMTTTTTKVINLDTPYNELGVCGVWHRPNVMGNELSVDGIKGVLDEFMASGVNLIFLETFYHGMTIYNSQFVPLNSGFKNIDYSPYDSYLDAFLTEAEKRSIEVHAWVEDFYIGVSDNYFTRNLNDWILKTRNNEIHHSEGKDYGGYIFLDPSNASVREYLINFYNELLTKYNSIKGLNLDYIRYPVSSKSDDTGYTINALNGFREKLGLENKEYSMSEYYKMVDNNYQKWVDYRASQVTLFVEEVSDFLRENHKDVYLSTAIFPETKASYNDKKQDFTKWLELGLIDIVTPMAYYDDTNTLKNALESMISNVESCYLYSGLSTTYHKLPNNKVIDQLNTTLNVGCDGYVFFGSQSILNNDNYINLLNTYNKVSKGGLLTVHSSSKELIKVVIKNIKNKLEESSEPITNIDKLVNELSSLIKEEDTIEEVESIIKSIRLLIKYNLSSFVSNENINLIKNDLDNLYRFLNLKKDFLLKRK